jgi:hypothetical protein
MEWIRDTKARNGNPRTSDCQLVDERSALYRLGDLKVMQNRPEQFIAAVFRDQDEAWVGRCGTIIREKT